ncbi:unnamed protein product [Arctogadus glacialis]
MIPDHMIKSKARGPSSTTEDCRGAQWPPPEPVPQSRYPRQVMDRDPDRPSRTSKPRATPTRPQDPTNTAEDPPEGPDLIRLENVE